MWAVTKHVQRHHLHLDMEAFLLPPKEGFSRRFSGRVFLCATFTWRSDSFDLTAQVHFVHDGLGGERRGGAESWTEGAEVSLATDPVPMTSPLR